MDHLLSWFDNRTLLVCQMLLVLLLATALFVLGRAAPGMRGVRWMALGYLLGVPGVLLIAARGVIPLPVSTIAGNGIALFSYYCSYLGIQLFFKDRFRYFWLLEISGPLSLGILVYFTLVSPNIVPRSMATAFFIALVRLLSGITLWRHSNARPFLRLGAAIYAIFAFFSFQRFILTLLQGSPQDYMQRDTVQTLSMITGFLYIGITGLFLLALIASEMREVTIRNAQVDMLTRALTRTATEQKFAHELEIAGRTGLPMSALLIDIDKFKTLNDTAGHAAGDDALRMVAQTIHGQLRPYDTFGRFGGDEMLLLLPGTTGQDALIVGNRICGAVKDLPPVHGKLPITVSIGIAQSEPHDTTRSLLARADAALYHVKRNGRNAAYFLAYGLTPPSEDASEPTSGPRALAD